MIGSEEGRFDHEGDADYSQAERDEHQAKLDAVDEAKDLYLLEVAAAARKYGQALEAADPRFVIWFSRGSKTEERGAEAIQGFIEHAQAVNADLASDLKDHEEISRCERIVEVGRE